jgi:photosynthetic reaction center cytochrome c subunit
VPEFNRTMVAMTNWVSPEQGCNYCHYVSPQGEVNMASEDVYTKHVSRRMVQMVKYINQEWADHVGEEGVNCWTCHVGQPQPSMDRVWTFDEGDPNQHYYLDRADVRLQGEVALTADAEVETSIQNARNTYWFMIEGSQALGVNCTYCHNSARFGVWEESPPARVTALRAYRMVREINQQFVAPLADQVEMPDSVLGPQGDVPKVQCLTCHQGLAIPQYGMSRAAAYPGLRIPEAENPPPTEAEAMLRMIHGTGGPVFPPEYVGGP